MPFLYGGNVVKAHIGRWTEDVSNDCPPPPPANCSIFPFPPWEAVFCGRVANSLDSCRPLSTLESSSSAWTTGRWALASRLARRAMRAVWTPPASWPSGRPIAESTSAMRIHCFRVHRRTKKQSGVRVLHIGRLGCHGESMFLGDLFACDLDDAPDSGSTPKYTTSHLALR